jgi:hypothetical protein
MNIPMNDMEKIVAELQGMLKTAENSIKKNPNHVMKPRIAMSCMGCFEKEKKRGSVECLPRVRARKRIPMSTRALNLKQKASLTLLLMSNASIAIRRDIGSGTVRSTRRSKRRRREVILLL